VNLAIANSPVMPTFFFRFSSFCRLSLFVLATCSFMGCAHGGTGSVSDNSNPEGSARRAYFKGMKELVAGNHNKATEIFSKLSRGPRYLRYGALARLRIGDAFFVQKRWDEAIEAYRAFVAQYATDPNLPYARYRIAAAYHRRLPDDWFLTPNAHEMEQTMTNQAVRELQGFMATFATSRYAPQVREMLGDARSLLLSHEFYVADYYEARENWRGVAWRLESAVKNYPDLALTPELLFRMANAYEMAGDIADAARCYGTYLEQFPEGTKRQQCQQSLDSIRNSVDPDS
jgi:outer membrane protein assembly factor BamD